MSFTQADVDALKGAIAGGEKRVTYRDITIEYRDLPEMLQTLAVMEREVAPAKPVNRVYPRTSKGL